jgi:flavin reductase (DIM6/NTAB) family NADH-FMN oxidoreductase RutF
MYSNNGTQPHGPKDTLTNIRETKEFVVNVAPKDLREAMNITSLAAKSDEDKFALAGLSPSPSVLAQPPINMECRLVQIIDLMSTNPKQLNTMVIGHVVGLRIDVAILSDGKIDNTKLKLLTRLGYKDYACMEKFSPWTVLATAINLQVLNKLTDAPLAAGPSGT